VRLATVHYRPAGGKTALDNCRIRAVIAAAAKQKADLVRTRGNTHLRRPGKKYHEVAESIPGPSTEYFGELAKKATTSTSCPAYWSAMNTWSTTSRC